MMKKKKNYESVGFTHDVARAEREGEHSANGLRLRRCLQLQLLSIWKEETRPGAYQGLFLMLFSPTAIESDRRRDCRNLTLNRAHQI